MKKIIAILLVVISIVSLMSIGLSALAADNDTNIYVVIYAKGGVPVMYEPTPTYSYEGPGTLKVSKDTPIAIDYDFVCWEDQNGVRYWPGDTIIVNGEVKLTPIFAPKTDSDSHTTRTIKAGFQSLIRVLQKMFGIFKDFEDFNAA